MLTIFPDPVKITEKDGFFSISREIAGLLENATSDMFDNTGVLEKNGVILFVAPDDAQISELGVEGYELKVSGEKILISANSKAGCFYGIQTIRWLTSPGDDMQVLVPCCEIVDFPRFPYRGYMLDEARYFLGPEMVKSVIDWMSLLKLNRFHWHLTEDQGWRVEIKKYPKLTGIGSKRASTPVYRNKWNLKEEENSDGIPHAGYYTQEQVRELVEYASKRFITIVPEIEMPGHATAALASYPEMRCLLPDDLPPEGANIFGRHLDGPDIKVSSKWGVHANLFCVSKARTMSFLHDVLEEISSLFPGPVIHIGGDEVPKTQWMCCERCQENIEALGLASEEDLQKKFTGDIIDYLAGLGKITMLWNEHADESLARRKEHVICQYWTGSLDQINEFLDRGGRVVMSPSRSVYLDHAYHFLPLEVVYHYDPLEGVHDGGAPGDGAAVNAGGTGILGIEAPMWGEVFQNKAQVEWCTFPRIFAITDIAWVPQGRKNYSRFLDRLPGAFDRLDEMHINHATLDEANPGAEAISESRKDPKFGKYAYFD
ncbi:MAG: beta-N-acetylhexosaminidase [Promethearchaeota archaeon]